MRNYFSYIIIKMIERQNNSKYLIYSQYPIKIYEYKLKYG